MTTLKVSSKSTALPVAGAIEGYVRDGKIDIEMQSNPWGNHINIAIKTDFIVKVYVVLQGLTFLLYSCFYRTVY